MTATTLKGYRGIGMEGPIARWYEKTVRQDLEQYKQVVRQIQEIAPSGDLLEVAPGPGFLAIELARARRYRVTGLDVSKTFVELARRNANEAGVQPEFIQGNASAMPFPENSFDLLVCRAAFKNFSEPVKALAEMQRVLRPGGTGLIIDLRRDTPVQAIKDYVSNMRIGLVSRWFTMFTFRHMLLRRAYTQAEMETMLAKVPFAGAEVRAIDIGLEVRLKK